MTTLDRLHRRPIRQLGGRKAIPKGSETDRALRAALDGALFTGACRERTNALDLLRAFQGEQPTRGGKLTVLAARAKICTVPISTVVAR